MKKMYMRSQCRGNRSIRERQCEVLLKHTSVDPEVLAHEMNSNGEGATLHQCEHKKKENTAL